MMQRVRTWLCASLAMLVVGLAVTPVSAAGDEGAVRTAIDLLQSAKKSDTPVPVMRQALKELKDAPGIKGSVRLEANQHIKAAIAAAETGDKAKMVQKVNAAIAKIHKGVGLAK
jgi:hypothetical protein